MSERKPKYVSVQLLGVSELKGAPYNPRKRDSARFELVKTSLKKLGWLLPMYVTDKGEILSGHQRFDAAKELGAQQVPAVVLKNLDLDRRRGANIVFNRATNDMHKTDSGGALAQQMPMTVVEEAAQGLSDVEVKSNDFFP